MSGYLDKVIENYEPHKHFGPDQEEIKEADDLEEAYCSRSGVERGGIVLTNYILHELDRLSSSARESVDDGQYVMTSEADKKDDLDLFFTFTGQIQEYLLRSAVIYEIIADDATTEETKKLVHGNSGYRGYSFRQCLQLLSACDIIDDGLKGEIEQARNERNETVHDITRWMFGDFESDNLRAQISRAERSTVRLLEIVYELDLEQP